GVPKYVSVPLVAFGVWVLVIKGSAKIVEREQAGRHFTIVVVAEGARAEGGDFVTSADQSADREARLGGIGSRVANEIQQRTGKESRAMVLGHLQRGGGPTNFDRALCTL
ncbi:6-phosphofructokinase, partial [Klebsiella pneumoniae]|uniref:6-phosphofructokinase n=1 Tax=Klebsiella pneumoniae TaxID=573 RepID=UPI00321865F1